MRTGETLPQIGETVRVIRYGHPVERSTNHATGEPHIGMSCYLLDHRGVVIGTVRAEFADRLAVYIGRGVLVGYGADDEPLVTAFRGRRATRAQEEIAYYGMMRAAWLTANGYMADHDERAR